MKKTILALFLGAMALLSGCSSVTQEMQDGVSFEGLKKIYVDKPVGTASAFGAYADVAKADAALMEDIRQFLRARGFVNVENKADAQIVFRPLWNCSLRSDDLPTTSNVNTATTLGIGTARADACATLEIQAILPDGDIWAWRGFSPVEMSAKNFRIGSIKTQVEWCLEYFPPEEHPAFLQEYKKEKAQKDAAEAENPYKEALVKQREAERAGVENKDAAK